jgi:hypothetical protein
MIIEWWVIARKRLGGLGVVWLPFAVISGYKMLQGRGERLHKHRERGLVR